jgi:subtilisin family serine protease
VPQIGLVTVRPAPGRGGALHALAQRMRALPGVAHVEDERRHELRYVPNDPGLRQSETTAGTPPGTPLSWWLFKDNLPGAWDITRGAGAKVAVIDTGADANHPDFAGRITAAVDLDADHTTGAGYDEQGHGTHVASIACANGDDGRGLVGAAYGCSLMIFKSDLSDSSVAAALVGATDRGAEAVNMSFGTDGTTPASQAIVDAIEYAYRHEVVMVAAAADEPTDQQGDPPNVLQPTGTGPDITQGLGLDVTAATVGDARASFAGYGSQISMAAYGAWQSGSGGPRGLLGAFPANTTDLEIPSLARPGCNCRTSLNGDNRYAYLQGTSMAAPQVTAVAAQMRHLNPDLPAAKVIRILKQTARRPSGAWTPDLGWGILDAANAMATARIVDLRAPVTSLRAAARTRKRTVTLTLRSKDGAPARCVASGVKAVRVYRRKGTGRWTRIATTTKSTLTVKVQKGSYAFYSVGVDKAGNREKVPRSPDARTRVS